MIYIPSFEVETSRGWTVHVCEASDVEKELTRLLARIEALEQEIERMHEDAAGEDL